MSDLEQDLIDLGIEPAPAPVQTPPDEAPLKVVGPDHPAHPMEAQWRKWRAEFARAMDGSHHDIESVERLVFQHKLQFWPGDKAAMITELMDYSGAKALQVMWMAGDMAEAKAMAPGVMAFGRLMGCTEVLIEGRLGWQRELRSMGFKPWSVTLRMAIT